MVANSPTIGSVAGTVSRNCSPGAHQLHAFLENVVSDFPSDVRNRGVNRNWQDYRFVLRHLAPVLGTLPAGREYLDIGAGAGVIPLVLAKAGLPVTVMDTWSEYADSYDNQMGTYQQFMDRFARHGVRWIEHNALNPPLPLPSSSFDMISMFHVLEHLASPRTVMQEIYRLLRPNGVLILTLPNVTNLRNRLRLLAGRSPHTHDIRDWFSDAFFGHYREMTIPELRSVLPSLGLVVETARYTSACHWNTRYADGQWGRTFRLNSYHQAQKLVYQAVVSLIPSCRYEIFLIARKRG